MSSYSQPINPNFLQPIRPSQTQTREQAAKAPAQQSATRCRQDWEPPTADKEANSTLGRAAQDSPLESAKGLRERQALLHRQLNVDQGSLSSTHGPPSVHVSDRLSLVGLSGRKGASHALPHCLALFLHRRFFRKWQTYLY